MAEIIITDDNYEQHLPPTSGNSGGLEARDFFQTPHGSLMYAPAFDIPLIPESEWEERLAALKAAKAQNSDIRNRGNAGQPIPSRDQDGYGYCWCHSGTSAMLIARARAGLPYADLSAFAVGCIIKNYRNRGGFGAEGLQFIAEKGVPTSEFWPQKSTSSSNDNPKTWENAALHRATEWMDLDPSNMKAQFVTCLLMGFPVVSDFNWWSHSVCTLDLVSLNPFTTRIWNSWTDSWSENGTGLLQGSRAIPNNALALRTSTPSTK